MLGAYTTGFSVQVLEQPLLGRLQEEISCLMLEGRPEFGEIFGVDHRLRLAAPTGLLTAVGQLNSSLVCHACLIYDAACPDVGLLAHVFTHPDHRRRGVSSLVCRALLQAWDRHNPYGSVVLLGTGSPHAAKVYQREGFTHLLGGLDMGLKGYNVDDMGEWIMVRDTLTVNRGVDKEPFHTRFFTDDPNVESYSCEPLSPSHLPGLVLLFTSKMERNKMATIGVDTGLEAEEALLRLMMVESRKHGQKPFVVFQGPTKRIHGLAMWDNTTLAYYAIGAGAANLMDSFKQDGRLECA